MPKKPAKQEAPVRRARRSPGPINDNKYFEIRRSGIQGRGGFATRRIRKGTRIIEYVGEIISVEEADRRYPENKRERHHTFLFTLDRKRIIDAEFDGNDARFINHCCQPNCITVDYDGRIYIESKRTIEPGEELTYDYRYDRSDDPKDDKWQEKLYSCHCGAPRCRGTILVPRRKKRKPADAGAKKKSSRKKGEGSKR
jgi:uncharacterized protein